jgi:cysteine synthase A
VKVALDGGTGQTIVTILCDSTQKYMSRIFDPNWLTENDLPPEDLSAEAMIDEMRAEL